MILKFKDRDGKIFKKVKYFKDKNTFESFKEGEKRIGEIVNFPTFKDVVYNERQKEFMKLAIAKMKTDKINLLLSGFAGTGKTYSSKMIACETQRPFVYLTGSMGKSRIIEMLQNLKPNALVLIDEIHNMSERIGEIIYPAIEYGELYVEGVRKLIDCCFIGTTTEPEKLPKPLLDRFMRIEFEEPDYNLIKQILEKRGIPEDVQNYLINHTTNIRVLNKLIQYIKLYGQINETNCKKVFKMMKINFVTGMSEEQEKYIDYLKKVEKSSLRNISLVLRRSENYVKLDIEPELIKKEIIVISSRGRMLS